MTQNRAIAKQPGVGSRPDTLLLVAVLALTAIGLVMVYSASAIAAHARTGDSAHYLRRQAGAAGLGILGMWLALKLGYQRLERAAGVLLIVGLAMLVLVLVPGVGQMAGGARRWIRVPGGTFQPTELCKLALVVFMARSLARSGPRPRMAPHLAVGAVMTGLILLQPDFGSGVLLCVILFALLFVAGARVGWLFAAALAAAPLAWWLVTRSEYRMRRVIAFLAPFEHRQGAGYQVWESILAIGSGGWTGLGLGDGRHKLHYLPEAHTDFIFSILAEELGLLGVVVVLALLGVVIWRGFRAALNAPDAFGAYLALGLTCVLGLGALINIAVTMSLLPTKGLTLPFLSFGGSSLVMSLCAAGFLLSVSAGRGGFLRPPRGADAV